MFNGRFVYSTGYNESFIKATEFSAGGSVFREELFNPQSRYSGFATDKHEYEGLDNLHKIELSADGARLFCGGKGLHVLSTENGTLTPVEIDHNHGKLLTF